MWATALVVASYVVLAVVVYWQAWSTGVATHLQLGGDQFANVWFLRWTPFALLHGHNPLFTTYANYPFGVNLVTNTSAPLLGVLGMPITLLFGSIATFNVMSTLAVAGSATAGYAFARRWTTWRPSAWVAGLLYGFSPYMIGQASGHLNLTFVVLPPLILLGVHEVVVRQQWGPRRAGIVLALLVTAQFFVSSEVLASTVVIASIGVATAAVVGRRAVADHWRRAVQGTVWAGGVAAVLLAYPVWFAVKGPGSISGPIQLVPQAYRADLLGLLYPGAFVRLAPSGLTRTSSVFANSPVENGSYLGITLVCAVVVSVVVLWRRSPVVRVAAVVGAAAWVLSLGGALVVHTAPGASLDGFPLPERIFTKLPLLSNTIPVRYSLYVSLFAGLVLALALDRLHQRVAQGSGPTWLRTPAGSALVPGLAGPGVPGTAHPHHPPRGLRRPGDPGVLPLTGPPAGGPRLGRPHLPVPVVPDPAGPVVAGPGRPPVQDARRLLPGPPAARSEHRLLPHPGLRHEHLDRSYPHRPGRRHPAGPDPGSCAPRCEPSCGHGTCGRLLASTAGVVGPAQSIQFLTWLAGRPPTPEGGLLVWEHLLG